MQPNENCPEPDESKHYDSERFTEGINYDGLLVGLSDYLSDSEYRELLFRVREYLDYTRRSTTVTDPDALERAKLATDLLINAVDRFLVALGMTEEEIQTFCTTRLDELAERLSVLNTYYSSKS